MWLHIYDLDYIRAIVPFVLCEKRGGGQYIMHNKNFL